jgi:hypothetical protein
MDLLRPRGGAHESGDHARPAAGAHGLLNWECARAKGGEAGDGRVRKEHPRLVQGDGRGVVGEEAPILEDGAGEREDVLATRRRVVGIERPHAIASQR